MYHVIKSMKEDRKIVTLAHGPRRREWGIQSISGATWNAVDTQVCYNWFSWYSRIFYQILWYSIMSHDYTTGLDVTKGMSVVT